MEQALSPLNTVKTNTEVLPETGGGPGRRLTLWLHEGDFICCTVSLPCHQIELLAPCSKKSHPEHLETYVQLAMSPGDHYLDLHAQLMCTITEIGVEGSQRALPIFLPQDWAREAFRNTGQLSCLLQIICCSIYLFFSLRKFFLTSNL